MDIRSRLKLFIDSKSITRYKFYKDLDLSNGFLDKEGAIGSDKCEKICSKYPDLSLEWLITGKGNMVQNNALEQPFTSAYLAQNSLLANNDTILLLKEQLIENKKLNREIGALESSITVLKQRIKEISEHSDRAMATLESSEISAHDKAKLLVHLKNVERLLSDYA